jgi:hypothetical protein
MPQMVEFPNWIKPSSRLHNSARHGLGAENTGTGKTTGSKGCPMKKHQIKVGGLYTAMVTDQLVTVQVDGIGTDIYMGVEKTHYYVTNLKTGRKLVFKSAARFRKEIGA